MTYKVTVYLNEKVSFSIGGGTDIRNHLEDTLDAQTCLNLPVRKCVSIENWTELYIIH